MLSQVFLQNIPSLSCYWNHTTDMSVKSAGHYAILLCTSNNNLTYERCSINY